MMGKAHGLGIFPKCKVTFNYYLFLAPLFWECLISRGYLTKKLLSNWFDGVNTIFSIFNLTHNSIHSFAQIHDIITNGLCYCCANIYDGEIYIYLERGYNNPCITHDTKINLIYNAR
jgi:hypothetical protein